MSEIKTNKISAIANADLQLNVQQTQRVLITPSNTDVTGKLTASVGIGIGTNAPLSPLTINTNPSISSIYSIDVTNGHGAAKMLKLKGTDGAGEEKTILFESTSGVEKFSVTANGDVTASTYKKTKPYLVSAYRTVDSDEGISSTGVVVCGEQLIDTQGIYDTTTGLMTSPFTTSSSYWRMTWTAQVKYTLSAVVESNYFQPRLNGVLINPITYTESLAASDGQIDHMSGSHIILVPASGTLGLHFFASSTNSATRNNEIITFELITVV